MTEQASNATEANSNTQGGSTSGSHETLQAFVDEQLKKFSHELEGMKTKFFSMTSDVTTQYAPRFEQSFRKLEDVWQRIGDVRTATGAAWEEVKLGFEMVSKDLRDAYAEATSKGVDQVVKDLRETYESISHRFEALAGKVREGANAGQNDSTESTERAGAQAAERTPASADPQMSEATTSQSPTEMSQIKEAV